MSAVELDPLFVAQRAERRTYAGHALASVDAIGSDAEPRDGLPPGRLWVWREKRAHAATHVHPRLGGLVENRLLQHLEDQAHWKVRLDTGRKAVERQLNKLGHMIDDLRRCPVAGAARHTTRIDAAAERFHIAQDLIHAPEVQRPTIL